MWFRLKAYKWSFNGGLVELGTKKKWAKSFPLEISQNFNSNRLNLANNHLNEDSGIVRSLISGGLLKIEMYENWKLV